MNAIQPYLSFKTSKSDFRGETNVSIEICIRLAHIPGVVLWDWNNNFESCKCYLILKSNKEHGSLKKGGIQGTLGNSWGIPWEYATKDRGNSTSNEGRFWYKYK